MKRHANGRWRNSNKAIVVSPEVRRARWVEAETLHLKRMGLSFEKIAEQITLFGRGEAPATTPMPQNLTFPPDYSITRQACHKAFTKAIAREPALEADAFRKLDTERCEEMYFNLQPAIRKGYTQAIDTGIRVLSHKARINGYTAPQKHELTGKDGRPLTLVQLLEAVGPIEDENDDKKE